MQGGAVAVGGPGFVSRRIGAEAGDPGGAAGEVLVAVSVDGRMTGQLVMSDPLRGDARGLAGLRGQGLRRILLAIGDRAEVAERIAAGLGFDDGGARRRRLGREAADIVLLVDRIDRIAPGIAVARGARAIALQSVVAGIGLSVLGMIAAALGHLTPVRGAPLREAIDVAVILNALRALRIAQQGPVT